MRCISVPGEVACGLMLLGADRVLLPVEMPTARACVSVAIHHAPVEAETIARTDERRELLVEAAEQAGWAVDRQRGGLVDRYTFTRDAQRHVVMGRRDRPLFWGATVNQVVGLVRVGSVEAKSSWSQPWSGVGGGGATWTVRSAVFVGGSVELPAGFGLWSLPESLCPAFRAEVAQAEVE